MTAKPEDLAPFWSEYYDRTVAMVRKAYPSFTPEDAEDIASEAFTSMVENARPLDADYLAKTALNLGAKRLRHAQVVEADRTDARHHQSETPSLDMGLILADAIAALPYSQRRAFTLIEVLGVDPDDAAEVLGCSRRTAYRLAEKARSTLRKELLK